MDLERVFDDFCEQLNARTKFTSEDTIRYYWFTSMFKYDSLQDHYVLEEPYHEANPRLKDTTLLENKELDLLYETLTEKWAVEIKFHRKSDATFAHTDAAGAIFADLRRLTYIPNSPDKDVKRLFLYVTDDEMHRYLVKKDNLYREKLMTFYTANPKSTIKSFEFEKNIDDTPKTFVERANFSFDKSSIFYSPVTCLLYKKDFQISNKYFKMNNDGKTHMCYVRLYEVIDATSTGNVDRKLEN